MPPPMNENSYRDIADAVRKAAQTVCQQSMRSAVENVKKFYEPNEDGVFDIQISGDGTCGQKGFSSIFGIVTDMLMVTGKAIDIEVMSKECRKGMVWRNKEETEEFENW